MLNRATALLNFADENAQFQRRYCSISPAEALNFNAVCNLKSVQEIMGHADASTTLNYYVASDLEQARAATNKFAAAFGI